MNDAIRKLEARIARLEKRSGRSQGIVSIEKTRKHLLEHEIPRFEQGYEDEEYIKRAIGAIIRGLERSLITIILEKVETQLNHIEDKTKKERMILDRLAPGHFSFNTNGTMYQEIRNQGHSVWDHHEVFVSLGDFINRVDRGKHTDQLKEMTNHFLDEAIEGCRALGI